MAKSVCLTAAWLKEVITVSRTETEQTRPADGSGLGLKWRCHPVLVAHLDDNWETPPPIGPLDESLMDL